MYLPVQSYQQIPVHSFQVIMNNLTHRQLQTLNYHVTDRIPILFDNLDLQSV
jgi:hypothetical protein